MLKAPDEAAEPGQERARASKTASQANQGIGAHTWSPFAQFLGSRKRGRATCASDGDVDMPKMDYQA